MPMTTESEPVLRDVPCPLCGGTRVRTVLREARAHSSMDRPSLVACTSLDHGAFGQIVACERCEIRFRSPREDDATILSFYGGVEDPVYLENEAARAVTFSRALRRLEAHVPVRGPLLDISCYTGVFLDVARAGGWTAAGLEPSRWAAAVATAKGHRVHCGTLETAGFEPGSFAVATMSGRARALHGPGARAAAGRPAGAPGWVPRALHRQRRRVARPPPARAVALVHADAPVVLHAGDGRAGAGAGGWELTRVHRYAHVVTMDYLLLKLTPYLGRATGPLRRALRRLRLSERRVPIDLGDFMTVYGRRTGA